MYWIRIPWKKAGSLYLAVLPPDPVKTEALEALFIQFGNGEIAAIDTGENAVNMADQAEIKPNEFHVDLNSTWVPIPSNNRSIPMTGRLRVCMMLFVFACVCSGGAVAATEHKRPLLSIHGYGTLGVVHSSDDKADYVVDAFRPNGAGHTQSWSWAVDSRLGLQVTAEITPKLSAVWQVISEQRYDNSYHPTTEWANLKYQFTPNFAVRIGRFVQPTFLFADTRKVAYTYPWVRPPTEVYNLVPVSHNDGVDVSYRMQFGKIVQTLEAAYGNLDINSPDRLGGEKSEAEDTFSVKSTTEYGAAMLYISYHQTHLTVVDINPLFDAFRQFGSEGVAIAERYDPDGDLLEFVGIGVKYDPGRWFAIGEWGMEDTHNALGKSTAWYLSGGYRFGSVTPYATFAKLNYTDMTADPGLTLSSLPPELAGPATELNAALNDILGGAAAQETITLGLRWDFMRNVAFKMQYEFIDRDDGSPGTFGNLQPGFKPGGKADLFSASINFVF